MGKKADQSNNKNNKINCNIRLTARALARGTALIEICRNR